MTHKSISKSLTQVLVALAISSSVTDSLCQTSLHWIAIPDTSQVCYQWSFYGSEQTVAIDADDHVWTIYHYDTLSQIAAGMYDGIRWTHFGPQDGLSCGQLRAIIHDKNGRIWVSGDSGIASYHNGTWHRYTVEDERTGIRRYGPIAADSNGNIWVATPRSLYPTPNIPVLDTLNGDLWRFDGQQWTRFVQPELHTIVMGGITSLAASKNGDVWLCGAQSIASKQSGPSSGLWHLENGAWSSHDLDDGNGTAKTGTPLQARAIHIDIANGVWLSCAPVADMFTLGKYYPAAVNYFDGQVWKNSSRSGANTSEIWLSPSGDQYYLKAKSVTGSLVTTDRTGAVKDSIGSSSIPYFPFYNINFSSTGKAWMTSSSGNRVVIETLEPSSGISTGVRDLARAACVYPNPSRTITTIKYTTKEECAISVTLFNVAGESVLNVAAGRESAGEHTLNLDLSTLPGGMYDAVIVATHDDGSVERSVAKILRMK